MDPIHLEFREAAQLYLLSIKSQFLLVKLIKIISLILFSLSILVVFWFFLFAFFQKPDNINCYAGKNIFYPRFNDDQLWSFTNYELIDNNYLNQSIQCSRIDQNSWSCLDIYFYNNQSSIKYETEKMNYFELTEYLNNKQKKSFERNQLLNCVINFKGIDRLFDCWIKFICDHKLFILLHCSLFELLVNWFINATLQKDLTLVRNGFLRENLIRNHNIMNVLRYCQSLLIFMNCLCYLFFSITPLALPFAYFILNNLNLNRIYVDFINLIIILLKYFLFLLKSTKFFVAE